MWLLATIMDSMGRVMTKESNDSRYSLGQHINSCHPASQSNFVPGKKMAVGLGRRGKMERILLLGIQTLRYLGDKLIRTFTSFPNPTGLDSYSPAHVN